LLACDADDANRAAPADDDPGYSQDRERDECRVYVGYREIASLKTQDAL
jgi:hypothetical protein